MVSRGLSVSFPSPENKAMIFGLMLKPKAPQAKAKSST